MKLKYSVLALSCLLASPAWSNNELPGVEGFINDMVQKHNFDQNELKTVFAEVEVKDSILKAIARPAEKAKPWHEYRQIFLTDSRIAGGVKFWQAHKEALDKAQQEFGVPAEIIIAILGVETRYGGNVGGYRVIDALSTLAFCYPPRSPFFTSELENFLILAREEHITLLEPVGSYAGAMGLGQFMPSSYRSYAVDFDGDGQRDIWTNPVDAIGSIANYLKRHGWVAGESIIHRTKSEQVLPKDVTESGLKPSFTRAQLQQVGLELTQLPQGDDVVSFVSLTQPDGEEYWLGRQNFYAITRYNHSPMYAMAVTQLAQEIKQRLEAYK